MCPCDALTENVIATGQGELHYLRLMILYIRGAASYKDLRTVDGTEYATFKEAAMALGVLDDDMEVERCLKEASQISTSARRVRWMLAYLLSAGEVANIARILEQCMKLLAEDFLYEARQARLYPSV